jgi:hypothetical protein
MFDGRGKGLTRRREDAKGGFGEGEMGKIVFFLALVGAGGGWFSFGVSREDAEARRVGGRGNAESKGGEGRVTGNEWRVARDSGNPEI